MHRSCNRVVFVTMVKNQLTCTRNATALSTFRVLYSMHTRGNDAALCTGTFLRLYRVRSAAAQLRSCHTCARAGPAVCSAVPRKKKTVVLWLSHKGFLEKTEVVCCFTSHVTVHTTQAAPALYPCHFSSCAASFSLLSVSHITLTVSRGGNCCLLGILLVC